MSQLFKFFLIIDLDVLKLNLKRLFSNVKYLFKEISQAIFNVSHSYRLKKLQILNQLPFPFPLAASGVLFLKTMIL